MKTKLKLRLNLFPYLVWMVFFVLVPLVLVIIFAFSNPEGRFTLENVFSAMRYSDVFSRSIMLGAISTTVCLVLGYPMAYFISKIRVQFQNIFIMLLMIPMWTSFLLRTYAWMTILEYNGLLNKVISFFGFEKIKMINTPGAIVLGMVYNFLPYMILPIYTSLAKMDKRLIESAEDLGANKLTVFMKVILPLSLSGVISGITMVFVPSVSTFVISKMLGGGAILVIGDLIEMQFLGNSYNPYLGSAISLVLMIIIMICMGIMNKLEDDYSDQNIVA